jgi:hypothetical protein
MRYRACFVFAAAVAGVGVPSLATGQPTPDLHAAQVSPTELLRHLVLPKRTVSRDQRLFQLWFAQTLLDAMSEEASGGADIEQIVADGALSTLDEVARDADPQLREAASALAAEIRVVLRLADASSANAASSTDDGRWLVDSRSETSWFLIPVQSDKEYAVHAASCSQLRALVLDSGGGAIAGRASEDGSFRFRPPAAQTVRIGLRTPLCTGQVEIAEEAVAVDLLASTDRNRPAVLVPGDRYRVRIADDSQWFVVKGVERGLRYVIDVVPDGSNLDPRVSAYDADDPDEELASDDDGGRGWASRLEVAPGAGVSSLLLNVEAAGGAATYVVAVRARPHPATLSVSILVGTTTDGVLTREGESWWRLTTLPGRPYAVEVLLDDRIDSRLTVYDADGTTRIGEDDDGGKGLGSRLEFTAPGDEVLIKVTEIDGVPGRFRLAAEAMPAPADAVPLTLGITASGVLRDSLPNWWRFEVESGRRYRFEVTPVSPGLDTVIGIYGDGGSRLLASDDDGGTGLGSLLDWTAESSAPVYVKVSRYPTSSTGDYRLRVMTVEVN